MAANEVLVINRGTYCIVRSVPSSVGALRGALGAPGQVPSEELRRRDREVQSQGRQR